MSTEHIKKTLLSAIDNIKANPGAAKVVFRASTELGEGMHCTSKIREFPAMSIDEPPELGGMDRGPNPVEVVLAALGTCQEIVYRAYGAVMGIPLESVKCDVRGHLDLRGLFAMDPSVRAGFQKIMFETKIRSSASPEAMAKLVQVVETHCPVLNTLQVPVEVTGSVTLNDHPLVLEATA
ncbi:MAG: OsmC family protein [Proteobacteria bacterium]|nr:OsmC family protein [Pseudomonadota bacterium]MBS0268958.1 OsmC family protein [Pseudomonadota bacterium]